MSPCIITYNMPAGSILPVSIHDGKLHFLFGKENSLDETQGWSDFGGGMNCDESPLQCAMREGCEEMTGFLGNEMDLKQRIKKSGGIYPISIGDYHIHIFIMEHDDKFIEYYNNNHKYLWNRMDRLYLKKTALFEKIEIKWMTPSMALYKCDEFRPFYKNVLNIIFSKYHLDKIEKFVVSKSKTKMKTKMKTKTVRQNGNGKMNRKRKRNGNTTRKL
jgi:hypothetical protein